MPVGAFLFTGAQLEPWRWLGFLGLIAIHQLGHLLAIRAARARLASFDVTGLGGECRTNDALSPIARAAVASAGVAAQLILLGVIGLCRPVPPSVTWLATIPNAWLIAVNLLPIAPFEGAEAWTLPWRLGQALRRRLSNYRDVRHLEEDPEDAAMNRSSKGAEAKEVARNLLQAARDEQDP